MKRFCLQVLVAAVFLSAPPVWASSGVISIGGISVGTPIMSLPYTISKPGLYVLKASLTTSGDGITISAGIDNVTIDLMGFCLTHSGSPGSSAGIYLSAHKNVEVRNGTVRGFKYGILEESNSGASHRVINIRAVNNSEGILLNGKNHLVQDCTGSNNTGTGIYVDAGKIVGCVACNNGSSGISLSDSGSLINNVADYNYYGFRFWDTPTVLVSRNSASNNTGNQYGAIYYYSLYGPNAGLPFPY